MINEPPVKKSADSMHESGLPRSADSFGNPHAFDPPAEAPAVRPLGGQRISFVAWGLAGVVGLVLWVLILKLL